MMRSLLFTALMCAGPVLAHVTVSPVEAPPGAFQRYTLVVPGEKSLATTRLEVEFPQGLRVRETEALTGWRTTVRKDAKGDIVSAVWEGGSIPSGQFAEFGAIARNPDAEAELSWKAIQTYQDGSEVQWNGPPSAQFPAAVTMVRAPAASSGPGERVLSWTALILALLALVVAGFAWRRATKH
jgi:uncharacterized protein YcnI